MKKEKPVPLFHNRALSEIDDVRFVEGLMSLHLFASGRFIGELPCKTQTQAVQWEADFWAAKKKQEKDDA
jgi:hypothetical protein